MNDNETAVADNTGTETSTAATQQDLVRLTDELEALIKKQPKAGKCLGQVVHAGADLDDTQAELLADTASWFGEVNSKCEEVRALPNGLNMRFGHEDLNGVAILGALVSGQASVRKTAIREALKERRARS